MTRSLDFTACSKQDECPVKDCWRKLTDDEKDWLEKNPNRQSYADFDDCIYYEPENDRNCIEDNTPHLESTVLFKTENDK